MNSTIRMLSPDTIGKIAAGEVVERPAAAVKEMVENSLDAGASAISVEIRDGGITYIRVTDNGSGIAQGDIRMAFERHATSKITSAEDLSAIETLGFRGEALASIAAVSRVTLTTRTSADASGIRARNEGGSLLSVEEAACPVGTSIIVKDLFYNAPVRLKFLKKPATEAANVADVLMRMILSRPDVSFRLTSQGKNVYHSAGDGQLASAVFAIYGSEMSRSMRHVSGHQGGLVLDGYVGIGESGRGTRAHQSFFVNGRYFRSGLLSAAVEEACRERVMIGKVPACVLHLTMPFENVDVNVHPNKLEVRFADEAGVSAAVTGIVRDGIADRDALERPVPLTLTPERQPTAQVTRAAEAAPPRIDASPTPAPSIPAPVAPVPAAPVSPTAAGPAATPVLREAMPVWRVEAPTQSAPQVSQKPLSQSQPAPEPISFLPEAPIPMRLIGVAFKTYIIVEYADQLLLIDQHAVHERLLYERYMSACDTAHAGQELLIPLLMHVTPQERQTIQDHADLLREIGFEIEPFGEDEVSLRAIPMVLGEPQSEAFLRDALDQLMSDRHAWTGRQRRDSLLQAACKHAVKGGEELDESTIRELVTRMVEDRVTPTCPHGRPLVVSLTHTELDRKFRRIQ